MLIIVVYNLKHSFTLKGNAMNNNSVEEDNLQSMQKKWGWFLGLGILLIIVGLWASGYSIFVSAVAVIWFGVILFLSGIFQLASQFLGKRRHDFWFHLLFGVLSIGVGLWIMFEPLQAAATLTWIIGVFLAFIGVIQIIYSIVSRKEQAGWMLFNGVVDLLLAIIIWVNWPESGLWVIGLFVSIQVILVGWMLLMIGVAMKR